MTAPRNYLSVMRRRPRYLSALGLILVETTGMEFLLGELLAAVMRTNQDVGVAIYHAPRSNTARLDILASAIDTVFFRGSLAQKHLNKIVNRARGCLERRNQYVHGLWGLSPNKRKVFVQFPPGPRKEVKLQDLKNLVRDLQTISTEAEMHKRAMSRQVARSASPEKPP